MEEIRLARRQLFAIGGRLFVAATAATSLSELVFPGDAQAIDWLALFKRMVSGGHGTVRRLVGSAYADERPLKVGQRVPSGAKLRSTHNSQLVLSLSDNSALRLSGETMLVLRLDNKGRGILNLISGAVLAVIPTDHRYLVLGATATVGVKGTVFFRELFPPNMTYGTDMAGKRVEVPPDARDYFCTCHGDVDYLYPKTRGVAFEDRSTYHSAYFLNLAMPEMRERSLSAINHTDPEIRRLVGFQEGRKHDLSWLRS
jgi:hypothetical protein